MTAAAFAAISVFLSVLILAPFAGGWAARGLGRVRAAVAARGARAASLRQWSDVLNLSAGLLRSGATWSEVLSSLADIAPEPFRGRWRSRREGLPPWTSTERQIAVLFSDERLGQLGALLASAVLQGGAVADLLERSAKHLEDREELRARALAWTAEGRFAALVTGASPAAVFGLLAWMAPQDALLLVGTPAGRWLLCAAVFLSAAGTALSFWVARVEWE